MKALISIICLCCLLLGNTKEVRDSSNVENQSLKNQQERPSFHFRPPRNWLNDPNGPMYYKGVYHLFYQYNPYGATFNKTIVWGHSVSKDLINWIHLKNAIVPTKAFDINSCFSGSTTILPGNKPVILYTGVDAKNQQVQNLATPKNFSDPFLEEWVKYEGNPVISPPQGVKADDFRDPTTAWRGKDGKWKVVVGGAINGAGVAILYESKDFVRWHLRNYRLSVGEKTGVWECPDFYPVFVNGRKGVENVKYVMKASFHAHDYYVIGRYDGGKEKFVSEGEGLTGSGSDLRYDYGKFYASKTFFDSRKKRRVLWGWINESDSANDDVKKGWAGVQSVPREVYLSTNRAQLVQWPVKEIEKLREKRVSYSGKKLKERSLFEVSGITASQADIEVTFSLPKLEETELVDPKRTDPQLLCSQRTARVRGRAGPFGLLVMASKDLKEQTAVFFRILKKDNRFVALMCSDQSRSSVRKGLDKTTYGAFIDIDHKDESISLRSLVDHSVIESFGAEGRACITARVYPRFSVHKDAHVYVFNNGSLDVVIRRLDAWSMKKPEFN